MIPLLVACAADGEPAVPAETAADTDTRDSASESPQFEVAITDLPSGTLLAAWSAGDEVWFAGGDLAGLVGTTGSITRLDPATGTVCVEPDVWYAVGSDGRVVHEVAGERTREDLPTDVTLFGVWVTEAAVWAVGADTRNTQRGEVWLRRDGIWRLVETTARPLFKVWDGLVVGDGHAFRIEADDTLTDIAAPDAPRLVTVRGTAPDDAWAVGGLNSPILRHWDGSAWTDQPADLRCGSGGLNGVFTAEGDDVWIAGNFGGMGFLRDGAFTCASPPLTLEHFHAVWRHGETVYWAGGNLFDPGDNYGTIGRYGGPGSALTAECP